MSAIPLQWPWWQLGGYFTAASLCLNVWDGLLRLNNEVAFIWPMSWNAYIKWLYLFGKYFALAVQTVSLVIQACAIPPLSLRFCQRFLAFAMTAVTLLMFCFNALIILRIYGIYGRRTLSSGIATIAVLVEFGAMIASLVSTISVAMYDSTCIFAPVPASIMPYIIGTLVSQGILLWLAFRKRERIIGGRLSVAYITIRDGTFAFACISVFMALVFVTALYNSPLASLMIYWLPTISSISMCHIILNIQRTATAGPPSDEYFSTDIWGLDGSADSYLLAGVRSQLRSS